MGRGYVDNPPVPSMKPIFALIDCNNFFVSCERLFRPDLEGRPVIVLSSNDGCAISRSNEAKALGIPMGAPAFKYRQLFKEHNVMQFSANFELYGDISERITRVMTSITPRTEVYSVDESFLDLSELQIKDYQKWGETIRDILLREVGIPVSIGIAPTKTLAKLAAERAKKDQDLLNVLDYIDLTSQQREAYLLKTDVKDIWGIGWRLAPKLRAEGIYNALDLVQTRPQLASQLMGVHGRQLVAELSGVSCHPLEALGHIRQTVMNGRMFGHDTNRFEVVEAAIASLTARAAYSLRREGLRACSAALSISTNRHKPGFIVHKQFLKFDTPTADTGYITASLVSLAQKVFSPRQQYHRANVYLYDLVDGSKLQTDLLGQVDIAGAGSSKARLKAVDDINKRYGKTTIRYAAEGLSDAWEPKHLLRSPRYTTKWDEIPTAYIAD
jgi:DNA polymerase V